jgi:hypothetical protein
LRMILSSFTITPIAELQIATTRYNGVWTVLSALQLMS